MSAAAPSSTGAASVPSAGLEDMGKMATDLPKVEVPDVIMGSAPLKPDSMEQSFYEALADKFPKDLIGYMASENINALEDLACYCNQDELTELLLNCCESTRNQRKWKVPLTKLWLQSKAQLDVGVKRRSEGITDVDMETPMSQEDVEAFNKKHRQSY